MSELSRNFTRRRFVAGGGAALITGSMLGYPGQLKASWHRTPGLSIGGANSLRQHAADARLLFGFAVNPEMLRSNEPYRRLVEEQCSVIVAENAMKWASLAPTPHDYNFDQADELITFTERTRIKMRGHTLCWHEQLPGWFASVATPRNARNLLANHIRTVAGRYAGRMHSWDVVNEAIHLEDGRPDGLRNSPWLRLVGTDYLELAFRTAREADPMALLSYNEYGIEAEDRSSTEKRSAVLMLLRRLKQRNVPIDAVGIQSHLTARSTAGYGAGLQHFIQACREMDLQVFLSEMDVNDRELPGPIEERDRGVADTYGKYLATALAERNVTTVLTWGVGNAQTWLNSGSHARRDGKPQRPLLLDERLQPTLSFLAVREAFDSRNRTGTAVPAVSRPESMENRRLPKL
jgi:endo-1,4-beta-xylanase